MSLGAIPPHPEGNIPTAGLTWAVCSQVLWSISNVAPQILAARVMDNDGFGALATALSVVLLVSSWHRFSIVDAGVVRGHPFGDLLRLGRRFAVAMFALTAIVLTALAPGSLVLMLIASLGAAGVVLYDGARQLLFASMRTRCATAFDAFWALSASGLTLLVVDHRVAVYLAAWSFPTIVAYPLMLHRLKSTTSIGPDIVSGRPNRRALWATARDLSTEFVLTQGVARVLSIYVAVVAGTAAVAGLRQAELLYGPLSVLAAGVASFSLPRLTQMMPSRAHRLAVRCGTILSAFTLASSILLLVLQPWLGDIIYGSGKASALTPLIAIVGLSRTLSNFSLGPILSLKSSDRTKVLRRSRLALTPAYVLPMTIGGALGGAGGAVLGLALGQLVGGIVLWRASRINSGRLPGR